MCPNSPSVCLSHKVQEASRILPPPPPAPPKMESKAEPAVKKEETPPSATTAAGAAKEPETSSKAKPKDSPFSKLFRSKVGTYLLHNIHKV